MRNERNVVVDDLMVFRWTGWFGLAGVIFLAIEIPLWILPGAPPLINNAVAHAQYLADIRVIVLTRVLLDILMYMSPRVFFAGFRHLVVKTLSTNGLGHSPSGLAWSGGRSPWLLMD